ncbi:hypothetical protein [Polaromonas sp. CG9_12]|nr:hypothetical protein [Polaromonas sp. CG9_12]
MLLAKQRGSMIQRNGLCKLLSGSRSQPVFRIPGKELVFQLLQKI